MFSRDLKYMRNSAESQHSLSRISAESQKNHSRISAESQQKISRISAESQQNLSRTSAESKQNIAQISIQIIVQEWFCNKSCYGIYAILIPSNIHKYVALTSLCFQASLLSCHKCWPNTSPNFNEGPPYTVHGLKLIFFPQCYNTKSVCKERISAQLYCI